MIETKFIKNIVKEFQIGEFILQNVKNVGFSKAELYKTPLGEKIVIHASRPGLIVGRKGENIQRLTKTLKSKFKLENPQIEIIEVEEPMLNALIVGDRIASSLERFGLQKFKGIAHKSLTDVIEAGAKGVEIVISGKIPSSRAKKWRFYNGFLKKSGDIAVSGIRKAYVQAKLKTGVVGIQVRIMPPDLQLPDSVTPILEEVVEIKNLKTDDKEVEKVAEEKAEKADAKDAKEEVKEKKATKKKTTKKKSTKTQSSKATSAQKQEVSDEVTKEVESEEEVKTEAKAEVVEEVTKEVKEEVKTEETKVEDVKTEEVTEEVAKTTEAKE